MSEEHGHPSAMNASTQVGAKKGHHWWQDLPRRLSFQRNRTTSESEESQALNNSPTSPTQSTSNSRRRRFSEASAYSHETTAEIRERWNRNYNLPPECFVPPWI